MIAKLVSWPQSLAAVRSTGFTLNFSAISFMFGVLLEVFWLATLLATDELLPGPLPVFFIFIFSGVNVVFILQSYSEWDFYGHPGILDDTKSSDLTENLCLNHRTLIRRNEFACCNMRFPAIVKKNPITRRIRNKFMLKKENSCHNKNIPVTRDISSKKIN